MPPSDSTATSGVPPPTSTTIDPVGSATGAPARRRAATRASIRKTRPATEHQRRSLADGKRLFPAADAGDPHHRRLVQHDTAPFHVDDGVCRAEVDRHVGRQQTQHSSKHLTANPIEKRSISLSDWPAISNGRPAPSVAFRPPASNPPLALSDKPDT